MRQVVLSVYVAGICRKTKKQKGISLISRNARTVAVVIAEIELSRRVPGFCCDDRLTKIDFDPVPGSVCIA